MGIIPCFETAAIDLRYLNLIQVIIIESDIKTLLPFILYVADIRCFWEELSQENEKYCLLFTLIVTMWLNNKVKSLISI